MRWAKRLKRARPPSFAATATKVGRGFTFPIWRRAYLAIAESPLLDGEVFCLANEQQPRSVDVLRACLDAAGYRGEITFGPLDPNNPMDSWADQNEFISSAKARRILGWEPRHGGVIDDAPTLFAAWKAAQNGK